MRIFFVFSYVGCVKCSYWRQKCRKQRVLDLLLFGPQKLANPDRVEAKKELALERCAEQAQIYASEKLEKGLSI